MEFIILILAIVLFIPAIFIIMIATWLINVMFAVVTKGPRKGIQEIKTWKVQSY